MSIVIRCPNCGRRPIEEFFYGEVPVVPESITDPDERDLDRAFVHDNREGPVIERWFHAFGCRRWTTVRRDTRTDEVVDRISPLSLDPSPPPHGGRGTPPRGTRSDGAL